MSEIEKLAEKQIKKKIYELEILLKNFDQLIPKFKNIKEKRDNIKEHFEEELMVWKFILKIFKKTIYK